MLASIQNNLNSPAPVAPKAPKKPRKKLLIYGIAALVLIIASAAIWFASSNKTVKEATQEPVAKEEAPPAPVELASLVNGTKVSTDLYNRHPVAVMIENSPAARPQTGLASADLVYEAVTEGGITRFMGIFQTTQPTKAGPVRSARSYFIDYLSEYDAFYAHAGGSPTALSHISQYAVKDYPHNSDSYWREARAGVASEHTLFTDVSKIYKYGVEKKGWSKTADFKPWLFKDPSATPAAAATVTITFSSAQFGTVWTFDPATSLYARALAGTPHKDAVSGEQIKVRTIVAMNLSHSPNPPYSGTGKESEWNMATSGEGKATVFQDGVATPAKWKKPSRVERTRFYDATTDKEIELNRGRIWISVVPQEGSYSQS